MKEYKLFLASSMANSLREPFKDAIDDLNNNSLSHFNVRFELIAFSQTSTDGGAENTQKQLNEQIAKSDFFILLVDNNTVLGPSSFDEYKLACDVSKNNKNSRPYIKVFVLKKSNDDSVSVTYIDDDKKKKNFEDRLSNDSSRYMEVKKDIKDIKQWLLNVATCGIDYKQTELSYETHLKNITQDGVRGVKNYYRREKLDGAIDEKLNNGYHLLILEGNTYSGKTRAAFNVMKNRTKWNDFKFFIYDNRFTIEDLNRIRIDTTGTSKSVILIDDINDIVSSSSNDQFNRTTNTIWSLLNGLGDSKQEKLGKNYIILTVSGKLSDSERRKLYNSIFNVCDTNCSTQYLANLNDVIVNFDIYDKVTFSELVGAMLRDNIITKKDIRSGNYTIGSLFIKIDDIKTQLSNLLENESSFLYLFKAIVGYYKSNYKSQFSGYKEMIENIYDFFCRKDEKPDAKNCFEKNVEILRSGGYIITKKKDNSCFIDIDRDIILILEELIFNEKYTEKSLFEDLLDYAKDPKNPSSISIMKMGYLLCDRNSFKDDIQIKNLIKLIKLIILKILGKEEPLAENFNDFRTNKFPEYAVKVVKGVRESNSTYYPFFETAIARMPFSLANRFINGFKAFWDEKTNSDDYNIAIDLYKQMLYAMFSANNRRLTISEEKQLLSHIFDEAGEWLGPFVETDLNNIFNLARISPYLNMSLEDQVDLIAKAQIPDVSEKQLNNACSNDNLSRENKDDLDSEYDDVFDSEYDDDSAKEHNFLKKRMCIAIINLLSSLKKYKDFESVVKSIQSVCEKSESRLFKDTITESLFHKSFYNNVKNIVKGWHQEDCNLFFNFLLDNKVNNIFGIDNNIANDNGMEPYRTFALNNLLELLSSNDAFVGYHKMLEEGKDDYFTFSFLLKNKFTGFEELYTIFSAQDDAKQKNYITLNQLMVKAKTLSDASVCMRLMGIKDANPCKLKDEFALGQYFAIKDLSDDKIIEIIKEWRKLQQNEKRSFNITTLNVILNKFSIDKLVDIFCDKEACVDLEKYYGDKYGLLYEEEIVPARENAQLLTIFFDKLNSEKRENRKERLTGILQQKFEFLIANGELKKLVYDPIYKDSILSVYLKNELLFPNYDSVKNFLEKIENFDTFLCRELTLFSLRLKLSAIISLKIGSSDQLRMSI